MNILIIGAGGVCGWFLPLLQKMKPLARISLMDGDIVEQHNLDRQLFKQKNVGASKADALTKNLGIRRVTTINDYYSVGHEVEGQEFHLIIVFADNHKARRDALAFGDTKSIPVIMAMNEKWDSHGLFYDPINYGTDNDPRVKYPDILTSNEGSPFNCTGEQAERFPQLAVANFRAASHAADLFFMYFCEEPDAHTPFEIYTSYGNTEHTKTF